MDEGSIKQKLNAPKKISGFERQRQEAESKRLREEAETRKALRDFQDSFAEEDDDEDDAFSALAGARPSSDARDLPSAPRGPPTGLPTPGSLGGPRHFQGQSMRNSGPGTLGPPPSLKRKRELEEERERRERETRAGGMRGFGSYDEKSSNRTKSSPEPAVKRPTMLLSQLPKTIKEQSIKALMPATLKVEDITFVPPTGPGTDRRYLSAIVSVAADTPMSDVDSAVSTLQSRYLGFGCYLNISRHITSSTMNSALGPQNTTSLIDFQPFGAKPWINHPQIHSMRNAPPPESFDNNHIYQSYGGQRNQGPAPLVVTVVPPSDLKLLQAVHTTVEKVIQYGPTFERSLLSSPLVQHNEQWAWIFDATSQAHIYYRWLIYEYYSARTTRTAKEANNAHDVTLDENWLRSPEGQFAKKNKLLKLFDQGPLFQPPVHRPKFEHVFAFEDLVQDSGYVSSDDDSGDENLNNPSKSSHEANPGMANYLNPYRRAKFTHLLSRLPDNITFLRAGDVARVTNFVVSNAGTGAEEIVSMLVENVQLPYSRAVVYDTLLSDEDNDPDDWERREKRIKNEEEKARSDPSNAKLIALYLISSSLQASSTSGVRDAWKYRGLFETALRNRNTFEHLGRLEKTLSWGRLKSEQWKRKIGVVLGLWEKWSLFSSDTQKFFRDSFLNPKLSSEEQAETEKTDREDKERKENGKWKSGTVTPAITDAVVEGNDAMDIDTTAKAEQEKQAQNAAAKAAEAEEKNKALKERMANLKKNFRASRPTAADFLDKEKEEVPAPKISVSGFKMSLGSTNTGAGGVISSGSSSLGAKSTQPKEDADDKVRQNKAGDMFGDSDGE